MIFFCIGDLTTGSACSKCGSAALQHCSDRMTGKVFIIAAFPPGPQPAQGFFNFDIGTIPIHTIFVEITY